MSSMVISGSRSGAFATSSPARVRSPITAALELGERREYMPAAGGSPCPLTRERGQADSPIAQVFDRLDQLLQRACQLVELPKDEANQRGGLRIWKLVKAEIVWP
jgi:hypothetical protein